MSSKQELETKRLLLLLNSGMNVQNLTVIPPRPIYKASVSQKTIDANMAKAYPEFGRHDWGPYGKYEYLGPGTRYAEKQEAGIQPVNDLDRISMFHDSGYDSYTGGGGAQRALTRAYHDIGAGSAMILAGLNPWSDAPITLSIGSGIALIGQGIARIHPLTAVPMAIVDVLAYGLPTQDPAIGEGNLWII